MYVHKHSSRLTLVHDPTFLFLHPPSSLLKDFVISSFFLFMCVCVCAFYPIYNQLPPLLEAGGAEVKEIWTGEDIEAEARMDPDRDGDKGTTDPELNAALNADANANADADADADAVAVMEAVPDRKADLEMTGTGVTTGDANSLLVVISRRVTGKGRTVTILIGRAPGEFWAGAGFSSLAS